MRFWPDERRGGTFMLTLYTAIGTLKMNRDAMGKPVPAVINNHQEYGLSEHELIL